MAFTRAKTKLIILGSKSTLYGNELLRNFIDMMGERRWVYDLPRDAHRLHLVPGAGGTQSSPVKKRSRVNDENAPIGKVKGNGVLHRMGVKKGVVKGKALFGSRSVLGDIAKELGI